MLRVIASSPTDLEAVLDTIAEHAARVCGANDGIIHQLEEGARLRRVTHVGPLHLAEMRLKRSSWTKLASRGWPPGRAVVERRTIHVEDMAVALETEYPDMRETQQRVGTRTLVVTPLLREGVPIGDILIRRNQVKPFTEQQIRLLETFADQAVIAIENARLFEELERRNAELQASNRQVSETLEQQTAISEVLRVIAESPTDPTEVLQAIVDTAARLCEASNVSISRVVGDETERVANSTRGSGPLAIGTRRPLVRDSPAGRAILERRTIHVEDIDAVVDREYPAVAPLYRQGRAERAHSLPPPRSMLAIPLLREDRVIGALIVARYEVRSFTEAEIAPVGDVRGPGRDRH